MICHVPAGAGAIPAFLRLYYMAQQIKDSFDRVTILRRKQVEARTGLSRATIYSKLHKSESRPEGYDPSFPRPIKLSDHAVGWIEAEIDAWIRDRILTTRRQG